MQSKNKPIDVVQKKRWILHFLNTHDLQMLQLLMMANAMPND
jgi:hypothetical protein